MSNVISLNDVKDDQEWVAFLAHVRDELMGHAASLIAELEKGPELNEILLEDMTALEGLFDIYRDRSEEARKAFLETAKQE